MGYDQRLIGWTACLCVLLALAGCAHGGREAGGMNHYEQALADTDPARTAPPAPGSAAEKEGIERFTSFYRVFSEQTIRSGLRGLYAREAYFRDGFREVVGWEAMETYFVGSVEGLLSCTFDIKEVASHDGNYYFRWIMTLTMKRSPETPVQTVGMSHVRFDAAGRVTFHQDYWDTGVIYERLPLLGAVIRWIKGRI